MSRKNRHPELDYRMLTTYRLSWRVLRTRPKLVWTIIPIIAISLGASELVSLVSGPDYPMAGLGLFLAAVIGSQVLENQIPNEWRRKS